MRRILFVVPDLNWRGTTTKVRLLAKGLADLGSEVRVTALAATGSASPSFSGIPLDFCGGGRLIDVRPFLRLHRLIAEYRPELIHIWGRRNLRLLPFLNRGSARIVYSARPERTQRGASGWLLGRKVLVAASGAAEAEAWRQRGAAHVVELRPGTRWPPSIGSLPAEFPAQGKVILCVGPLERHKGFMSAIWVLDILRFLFEDLHLVIAGAGPDRARLQTFARDLNMAGHVHFLGETADLAALYASAQAVWIPSEKPGGEQVILEAQAAGCPVVAAPLPTLVPLVKADETAYLVAPGDKVAFARAARRLLDTPDQARAMGVAAQHWVKKNFSAAAMSKSYVEEICNV